MKSKLSFPHFYVMLAIGRSTCSCQIATIDKVNWPNNFASISVYYNLPLECLIVWRRDVCGDEWKVRKRERERERERERVNEYLVGISLLWTICRNDSFLIAEYFSIFPPLFISVYFVFRFPCTLCAFLLCSFFHLWLGISRSNFGFFRMCFFTFCLLQIAAWFFILICEPTRVTRLGEFLHF